MTFWQKHAKWVAAQPHYPAVEQVFEPTNGLSHRPISRLTKERALCTVIEEIEKSNVSFYKQATFLGFLRYEKKSAFIKGLRA